jgi:hypothetical protein
MNPMKASFNMARCTVLACTGGQRGTRTMESSEMAREKGEECISIQMEESKQATGSTRICTARASLLGRTADAMRGNMCLISRRAMESSNGNKSI